MHATKFRVCIEFKYWRYISVQILRMEETSHRLNDNIQGAMRITPTALKHLKLGSLEPEQNEERWCREETQTSQNRKKKAPRLLFRKRL